MSNNARSRCRAARAVVRILVLAFALAFPALAAAQEDSELRRSFEDVMRDPSGVAPNLAYARVAIARGELRKALAAYERILARDPTNEEALAGRARVLRELEPETIRVVVSAGATYQTNPRHANVSNSATDDFSYGARVALVDERRALGLRWRTEADVYAIQYTSFHDLDIGSAAARIGPVIAFDNFRRVHAFFGASYNWLARRTFFVEPTAGLNFEIDDLGPFRGVTVRWGYQFIGRHLTSRDGIFVEIIPRFVFSNLLHQGSVLSVSPYWRYNGVVGTGSAVEPFGVPFPSRLHQLGIRSSFVVPIADRLAVGVNVAYEYRHYFERFTSELHHRRDHVVVPGGQFIVHGLAGGRMDVIASYNFEHRTSNDGVARYNNHIVGLSAQWRF